MRIQRDGLPTMGSDTGINTTTPSLSGLLALFLKDGKYTAGDWSSLIGIVTAICGNVLISFALNTQRYAHIKLGEQQRRRQKLLARARRRTAGQRRSCDEGYGTSSLAAAAMTTGKERRHQVSPNGIGVEADVGAVATDRLDDEEEDEEPTEDQPLLSASMHSETTEASGTVDGDDEGEGEDAIATGEARKSYLKSPYWWAGIVMMTLGEAGNFLAYGFAPASIVSPLGVVALISNCVVAPFFLKEPFRKRDLLGVLIAVAGAVTVVLSANDSNPKLGPKEIWSLISTWEFETYLGVTIAVICVLMWASSKYGEKSIFIDLGLVGLFGGYTALSTKGVASMLSYTVFKALTFPITYVLVAVLVFTAVMQIKYVNRALKRFDATQVIPTQFVLFTLSVIVGSAVLYRDFEKESAANAGKFIGGCAMTFLGVYLITSARTKDEDEDEVLEEDEEAIRLASEGVYHDDPEQSVLNQPSARRSSTGHLAHAIPVNGHRSSTPLNGSYRDENAPPQITRTSTSQSVSIVDVDTSQPASFEETSPVTQNPWILPEDQQSDAKRTMQRLLRPLENILPRSDRDNALPKTLKATTSEPILPSEAEAQPDRPRTPPNASQDQVLMQPHTPEGSNLLARHSISDFIPGPFTSTLSSPLSAIVADSLRRGVDVKSLKPRRRRRLPNMPRPGGSLQHRTNSDPEASPRLNLEGSSDGVPQQDEAVSSHDLGRKSRIRSLSNTFGELFRSKKRAKTEGVDDVEEGHAGWGPLADTERDS
ncbi:uncharacterized protein PV09_00138 [Verruconis gallopava]|uniref:DUF803-domain-containing protein n=1 Tax=Verruconis gallopava TaxID=253628 RepID=A0A0D2ARQ9_9PEZI|nr:uncharacterized protein PV09_00138 [Verruconis gallopava]KIW09210.1 hypothetical protein PV09_00138 [Verruconis gallopava]